MNTLKINIPENLKELTITLEGINESGESIKEITKYNEEELKYIKEVNRYSALLP